MVNFASKDDPGKHSSITVYTSICIAKTYAIGMAVSLLGQVGKGPSVKNSKASPDAPCSEEWAVGSGYFVNFKSYENPAEFSNHDADYVVYTDGSERAGECGAGVIIFKDGKVWKKWFGRLPNMTSIFIAETCHWKGGQPSRPGGKGGISENIYRLPGHPEQGGFGSVSPRMLGCESGGVGDLFSEHDPFHGLLKI